MYLFWSVMLVNEYKPELHDRKVRKMRRFCNVNNCLSPFVMSRMLLTLPLTYMYFEALHGKFHSLISNFVGYVVNCE